MVTIIIIWYGYEMTTIGWEFVGRGEVREVIGKWIDS